MAGIRSKTSDLAQLTYGGKSAITSRACMGFEAGMAEQVKFQILVSGGTVAAKIARKWFRYGVLGARFYIFVVHFISILAIFRPFVVIFSS